MKLQLDISDIQSTNLDSVINRLILSEQRRLPTEKQYKLLKWLSWKLTNTQILDIGTRGGSSALCLADNPSNFVVTYDTALTYEGYPMSELVRPCKNVIFFNKDISLIPDKRILRSPVISLDIDHSGIAELAFLNRLKRIQYNGLVIMDDINSHKFPALRQVFQEFDGKKMLMPKQLSHGTGTGFVLFGDKIEISI